MFINVFNSWRPSHQSPVLSPRAPVGLYLRKYSFYRSNCDRARRRGCVAMEMEGFPQISPKYRTWPYRRQLNKPQEKGMFTYIVPARMIPIDAALLLENILNVRKVTWMSVKFTYTVRISPKNWMLSPVWRMERAAYYADEVKMMLFRDSRGTYTREHVSNRTCDLDTQ